MGHYKIIIIGPKQRNPIAYLVVLPGEHLDAHDGKDEPEDETDEEDIEDTGDGLHQGIDNNLERKKTVG